MRAHRIAIAFLAVSIGACATTERELSEDDKAIVASRTRECRQPALGPHRQLVDRYRALHRLRGAQPAKIPGAILTQLLRAV